MTRDQVLALPPRVLTQAQREAYFEQGFLGVEGLLDNATIATLKAVTDAFVEQSRDVVESGSTFDVAPGHSSDRPRVRRLKRPDDQHEVYWNYATGLIADLTADLVGPDVVYHHSKLNFKWSDGDDAVAWHQDIPFYPHTNYSPLTVGTYLTDVGMDDGPATFLPGSQDGPIYDHYDANGNWSGSISPADTARFDSERAEYLTGPAGTITVHNCRTVHGSLPTRSQSMRPLLLHVYASADAFAYTAHPDPSSHANMVVRGAPARVAHHDPRPCPIPPDWSGGYTSIFAAQTGEGATTGA